MGAALTVLGGPGVAAEVAGTGVVAAACSAGGFSAVGYGLNAGLADETYKIKDKL